MSEQLTTTEKKCPKCGSTQIEYQGTSHGGVRAVAEGGLLPEVDTHQFKCKDCNQAFWFRGRM